MDASNKPEDLDGPRMGTLGPERAAAVRGIWSGALGHTVRCVPARRTVAVAATGGAWLFGKWHVGCYRTAAAEWRWLHVLPLLGMRTAEPLVWLGSRRRNLLVTAGVPGRALDVWAVEAQRTGRLDEIVGYACREVAPAIRRLHDHGLVVRDLYWNHLFCEDPGAAQAPILLDVARVLRPRWLWRRWVVKDLASLWASVPFPLPASCALRFLRGYLGEPLFLHARMIRAIAAKAARIRAHVPRFG
ncbi:MAG: hypothetical protein JNM25_15410 [Planctomycetes bacterium]|nr:hypothetical protein [Planctomycetota bacterium]